MWQSVNVSMPVQILQRHKIHLAQHHQALTCQICLDLMHRPFALAPCGHITCYNCLIRWFTALRNPIAAGAANDDADPSPENVDEVHLIVNSAEAKRGTYLRRRKTCPVCRAAVLQRPVEMWSIKAMVVTLVNSELVDLPVPVAPQNSTTSEGPNKNSDANNDPWRYIFHSTNTLNDARQGPLIQNQADHEHMGMYDIEDGGIYRCIDCFHEIWGGVCSGCNRGYPGHERDNDDHDDSDDSDDRINYLYQQGLGHQAARDFVQDNGEVDDEAEDIHFWDEDDEDHNLYLHHHPVHPMHEYLFLSADEGMTDSEGEGGDWGDFFRPFQPAFLGPPALGGIARIDEGSDEEYENDYDGSFIDDKEEEEGENMDDSPDVIELDPSSDEERSCPSRLSQARIQRGRRPMITNEDESIIDLDNEDNDIPARYSDRRMGMGSRNLTRRRAAVLLSDDSRSSGEEHNDNEEELAEDEDGEREVVPRSRARPSRLSQARIRRGRRLVNTSEDESIIDLDNEDNDIPARYSNRRVGTGLGNLTRRHAAALSTDDSQSSGEEHNDNEEELAEEDDSEREVVPRSRARTRWVSPDEE